MGRSLRRRIQRVLGGLLLVGLLLPPAQVLTARFVDPPLTWTMIETTWDYGRARGEWKLAERDWRDLDALGKPVPRAFVASEDARFWLHNGFDWAGICAAVEANKDGGRPRGGSTITQQTARNVFLWQGQSWFRKGLEALYTLWMELLLPKERILELYLNVAETGVLTFGAEAGARHWFGRSAADLDADQAGRLAAVLPSPRKWKVSGDHASRRSAWIQANPAPWPGRPGYDEARRWWATEGPRLWDCF